MPTRVDVRALVRGPAIAGLAVAILLMLLAGLIPAMLNWDVHMRSWPPLHVVLRTRASVRGRPRPC